MTTKKQQADDYVTHWMDEIEAGLRFRKKYSTKDNWEKHRKYYRGQWKTGLVPINKIYSYGRTLMPKVYFRAPRVTVTASRPDMVLHAKVVEALDNLLIKDMLLKQSLKMGVLSSYLCGVGPIKLGFDSEFGYLPEQAYGSAGETVTQMSTKERNTKIEFSQMVKPGMPWALHVRPDDVIVPWGSSDSYSLPWTAHYILRPLEDVKQDQKYKNTQELEGTRSPTMSRDKKGDHFRPRGPADRSTLFAELYEVRDYRKREIAVFCEDKCLLRANDELQTSEGPPWEFIHFNPDPEFFWSIPDAHVICPQQEELNETATQTAHHRRIALLKFLYREGALTSDNIEKFLSGNVGVAIGVKDVDSLASAIIQMQPHIPPDLYKDMQYQIQSMREILGFSQNQEGAFSPYHGKTATESMQVAQGFEDRVDERRDIMSDTLINIIRKWNQFLFKFWTEERVIQIVTPQGAPAWVSYTGDQLQGHYMLSIDADSGMPITRSLKYQMSQDLMKGFGGDALIDQIMLRQVVLDNFAIIDPRIPGLMQTSSGGAPEAIAAERQPTPLTGGSGKGSGGGRSALQQAPMQLDALKKQLGGK